jgi:hypothetical protein
MNQIFTRRKRERRSFLYLVCICCRYATKNFSRKGVGEVSTIFELFLSKFVKTLVLVLKMVVLDAEFDPLSNGIRFDMDFRHKNKVFYQTSIFPLYRGEIIAQYPSFFAWIRYISCAGSLVTRITCRIKFSIE